MFNCPNCGARLGRKQNGFGVFWGCDDCGGRAVGLGALRRAVQKECVNRMWGAVREGDGTPGRLCPACERKMMEVPVGVGADKLVLDVCQCFRYGTHWRTFRASARSPDWRILGAQPLVWLFGENGGRGSAAGCLRGAFMKLQETR